MPHYFPTSVVSPIPEVSAKYNCRCKFYGSETKVTVFSKAVFNPDNLEQKGNVKSYRTKREELKSKGLRAPPASTSESSYARDPEVKGAACIPVLTGQIS